MIIRGIASLGVVAALFGVLMTAGASPALTEGEFVVDQHVEHEREGEGSSREQMMGRVHEVLSQFYELRVEAFKAEAHRQLMALHEAGRNGEAEELRQELQTRLDSARELNLHIVKAQKHVDELRENGKHDEAEEYRARAQDRLAELLQEGRPEHKAIVELHQMKRQLVEAVDRIHDLREDGDFASAEALHTKLQENVEQAYRELQQRVHGEEASDLERMHQHAEELRKHIHQLREHGRKDDARMAEIELRSVIETIEAHEHRAHGAPDRGQEGEFGDIEQRAHHLHQAAESLHAAGMHDEAESLHEHAEEMLRHAERTMHGAEAHGEVAEMLFMEIRELRGEVHVLIELVEELHERLDELEEEDDD